MSSAPQRVPEKRPSRAFFRLRPLPIEWYVLLLPSLAALTAFLLFGGGEVLRFLSPRGVVQFLFSQYLLAPFFLLALYFLIRAAGRAAFSVLEKMGWGTLRHGAGTREGALCVRGEGKRVFLMLVPYIAAALATGAAIVALFTAQDADQVARFSARYWQWDTALFGKGFYLRVADGMAGVQGALAQLAYEKWLVPLTGVLLAAAYAGAYLFRLFLLAFFIAMTLGLLGWYLAPAVSPLELGVYPSVAAPKEIVEEGEALRARVRQTSGGWSASILFLRDFWQADGGNWLAVSSNPSFHVAAGTLIVAVAFLLHPLAGIAAAVWQLYNMWGTVYLLQHYVIDMVAGVALGALSLIAARALLRLRAPFLAGGDAGYYAPLSSLRESVGGFFRTQAALLRRRGKGH